MRALAIATVVLLLTGSAALAVDDIDVQVENFFVEPGTATVVLKITNNGTTTAPNVFVSCAFLDANQKAIDIGKAWVTDLAPNRAAYDKARIPTSKGVQFATCSVD
jgi:hypothetical protein